MKKVYLVNGIILVLFLTACSVSRTHQNRTGFFSSYASVEKEEKADSHFFEQVSDANLSTYNKILIPEVKVLSNTLSSSAYENELYTLVSAYATAAYRKNIMKYSSNYEVVDVPQKDTVIMQIAVSMIEVHPGDTQWDSLSALPFSLNASTYRAYSEGNVRLLVEARISDAMTEELLARSMRVVRDETIVLHASDRLQFKDFQAALDRWLNETVVKH